MKEKTISVIRYYICVVVMYLLIFQSIIQTHVRIFIYLDEIISALIIPVLIVKLNREKNLIIK